MPIRTQQPRNPTRVSTNTPLPKFNKSLFIFRRDLRLPDNIGLFYALKNSKSVLPCFIVDPCQIGPQNPYRGAHAAQIMVESLKDLNSQLKTVDARLCLFYGNTLNIVQALIEREQIDAIFLNYDYTPFSLARDEHIEKLCIKHAIAFCGYHDALLIGDPNSIKTNNGTPYELFGAFFKKASQLPVNHSQKLPVGAWCTAKNVHEEKAALYKKIHSEKNEDLKIRGGRTRDIALLASLKRRCKHYNSEHDFPALDRTTHLSAAHKFGTISIRESYHTIQKAFGPGSPLLRALYWRDFFSYVAYHSPFVLGHPYRSAYEAIPWNNNKKTFEVWCSGKTGFPIVDAGMRELNSSGFINNRIRMIVASFLVKDLHINWLWGERYFAQKLIDYDPAVNNGNWQWCASTGCDAQPYFQAFNPWIQQKKFDPHCSYIKRWIPELKKLSPAIIHTWYQTHRNHKKIKYPSPIIEHEIAVKKASELYKNTKEQIF